MPVTHSMKCQSTFDHFKYLKQSFQISQCTFKHSKGGLFNFISTKFPNFIFYFLILYLQIKLNIFSNALILTPLTPFFSLSSINNERYSGDLELRLRKYSKSPAIVCLKSRSLLNDSWRKRSNLLFRSNKPFQIKTKKLRIHYNNFSINNTCVTTHV